MEIQCNNQGWTIQKEIDPSLSRHPDALVDNDYIQAMDEVPVTFDNLQATMISTTMYYKADAIHLVDVKQK